MRAKSNLASKEREHNARLQLASKPADLQIGMLIPDVKEVLEAYLMAVYSMDTTMLPMRKMREGIYTYIGNNIIRESIMGYRRMVRNLMVTSISPMDYENEFTHISQIHYEVSYTVEGEYIEGEMGYPFHTERDAVFVFVYDQRLGWILSECLKDSGK